MEAPAALQAEATIRWGTSVLAVCPEPGCTMLTMGGACERHDDLAVPVDPFGRRPTPAEAVVAAPS